jgi:dsDNA-specific endonuclease/ATPase MutS2
LANPAAGRSNALNIAERLGLDPSIVSAARSRLGAGVAASNAAIGRLELVAAQVEGERLAAWAVEQQLAALQVGWPGGSGVLLEMLVRNSCVFYTC